MVTEYFMTEDEETEEDEINYDLHTDEICESSSDLISKEDLTRGLTSIEFEGCTIYQDDSILNDTQYYDKMKKGRAARGTDNKPVNLHHIDQTMDGGIIELTQSYHRMNFSRLHKNTGQSKSLIDRSKFSKWRRNYWKDRAEKLE